MAVKIRWTLTAIDDVNAIAEFIAKDSIHYAQLQTERFFQKVDILETHPNTGRKVQELNREDVCEIIEGNYHIIRKIVSATQIDILTVHHSNRLLSNNPLFG